MFCVAWPHGEAGEVVVVMGPSGSGKSTFIRTFNALEEYQQGQLKLMASNFPTTCTLTRFVGSGDGVSAIQFVSSPNSSEKCDASTNLGTTPKEKAEEVAMQLLERWEF